MFRPSTAPRWKRQTKTGRRRTAEDAEGRRRAYAALARNSGSSPRLNRTRLPDFMNALRVMLTDVPRPSPSLFLKFRPADRQADGERASLRWISDICELLEDDSSRMSGHGAAKDTLIDHIDEL